MVTATMEAPAKVSPAQQMKSWLQKEVSANIEFASDDLEERAWHLFGDDPTFKGTIWRGAFRTFFAEALTQITRESRAPRAGAGGGSGGKLNRRPMARWLEWAEHSGDRYIKFWHMRRPDLLAAAGERRDQLTPEVRTVRFEIRLAYELPDDNVTVGEHFGAAKLDQIWQEEQAKEVDL